MNKNIRPHLIEAIANDIIESIRDLTNLMEKMQEDIEVLKATVDKFQEVKVQTNM